MDATTTTDKEASDGFRDRDCPLCGADTEVTGYPLGTPTRVCTSDGCKWGVSVSPPTRRKNWSKGRRISDLEERVERLERWVEILAREDSP